MPTSTSRPDPGLEFRDLELWNCGFRLQVPTPMFDHGLESQLRFDYDCGVGLRLRSRLRIPIADSDCYLEPRFDPISMSSSACDSGLERRLRPGRAAEVEAEAEAEAEEEEEEAE